MKYIKTLFKLLLAITLLFVVFMFGAYKGITDRDFIGDLKDDLFNSPTYIRNSLRASIDDIPVLEIKLKEEEYDKIKFVREESLKRGVLNKPINKYSKGKFLFDTCKVKGKLKLKGIFKDHWENDKEEWSYKVKLKGGEKFLGLKTFNLMRPERRGVLNEWFYERLLNFTGNIYQELNFIHLKLNKKDLGLYLIEERINDDYMLKYGLDGAILKIGKSNLINSDNWVGEYIHEYNKSELKVIAQTDSLSVVKGMELFEKFRAGIIPANECFDLKQYAFITSICELSGTWHELMPHNTMYYFNKTKQKFELIINDGSFSTNPYHVRSTLVGGYKSQHLRPIDEKVYKDSIFHKEYYLALRNIVDANWVKEFKTSIKAPIDSVLKILYYDDPFFKSEQLEAMDQNKSKLIYLLRKNQNVRGYLPTETDSGFCVTITKPSDFAIQIIGGYLDSSFVSSPLGEKTIFANPSDENKLENLEFKKLKEGQINQIGYKIIGNDSLVLVNLEKYNLE